MRSHSSPAGVKTKKTRRFCAAVLQQRAIRKIRHETDLPRILARAPVNRIINDIMAELKGNGVRMKKQAREQLHEYAVDVLTSVMDAAQYSMGIATGHRRVTLSPNFFELGMRVAYPVEAEGRYGPWKGRALVWRNAPLRRKRSRTQSAEAEDEGEGEEEEEEEGEEEITVTTTTPTGTS